jgi:hypothetical protein
LRVTGDDFDKLMARLIWLQTIAYICPFVAQKC